jgi:hypothetical protein
MSVCAHFQPDRPRHLSAYAGYVVLCVCLPAQRAHTPIPSAHCPNECLYEFGARSVWPPMLGMWCCGQVCARSARINVHWRAPTPYLHRIVPMSVCANVLPERPSRLAAYTGHKRTGQDVAETILEKYYIYIYIYIYIYGK